VLVAAAFVLRFGLPRGIGLGIYIHDAFHVVPVRIAGFWLMLGVSVVWPLLLTAQKVLGRSEYASGGTHTPNLAP